MIKNLIKKNYKKNYKKSILLQIEHSNKYWRLVFEFGNALQQQFPYATESSSLQLLTNSHEI